MSVYTKSVYDLIGYTKTILFFAHSSRIELIIISGLQERKPLEYLRILEVSWIFDHQQDIYLHCILLTDIY